VKFSKPRRHFRCCPTLSRRTTSWGGCSPALNAHEDLSESWVFKGGTCLKKCYFETYRFSEDLDFTLRDEGHIDEEFLRPVFEEVIGWVTEQFGLNIPADQIEFDIYENPRGRLNCQGKIAYRGPVSPTSGGWPKIKLDLTADERVVLPSVRREVFHPYSDRPEGGIWANCYAYEEAFVARDWRRLR
jgi:predicted nucleotidyltransferase component of viral defense system